MTLPYARGSETSKLAAESMEDEAESQEAQVLELIRASGAAGMTDDEVEIATGFKHQSASARRNGLARKGWIIETGQKRKTRSGRPAAIWICSEDGRGAVRRPRKPTDEELLSALADIQEAVKIAQQHDFVPHQALMVTWQWLRSQLKEKKS